MWSIDACLNQILESLGLGGVDDVVEEKRKLVEKHIGATLAV